MQIYWWKGEIIIELLFIPAEVKGKRTSYVMVDNGSVINVCPLQILPNLGVKVEDGEVITIDANMSKTVSVVRDEQKQVVASSGFHVAMISTGIERDPRVSSMMKKMSYRSGQGLRKNEQRIRRRTAVSTT